MKCKILNPILTIGFAALVLFTVNKGLNGIRTANARAEQIAIMRTLLPGSTEFVTEPYSGDDANIRSVHKGENGFVVETVTAGYAGDITMLVGISSEGKVTGLVVRDLSETYGLGANALVDADFLAQFLNTSGEAEVGTNVDALTGATVTSKAIARSVNSAAAFVTGADTSSGATSWGG
ncbi:MAG: FMN-binding protein [Oscillospiraceae bacterium]|nr:FMN-binding protein [Oscillospiraceae bacterium]